MHPLLPLATRSEEIDKYYSVLGRALAYATEYEFNCRRLAHHYEALEFGDDYALQVWLLGKDGRLANKITKINCDYSLPDYTQKILGDAREARNWIAHEAAENHVFMLSTPENRRAFQADIIGRIDDIIKGNQIVLDCYRIVSNNLPFSHGSDMVKYYFAVIDWISVK